MNNPNITAAKSRQSQLGSGLSLAFLCLSVISFIRLQIAKLPKNSIDDRSPFVQRCAAAHNIEPASNGFFTCHLMYELGINPMTPKIQAGIMRKYAR